MADQHTNGASNGKAEPADIHQLLSESVAKIAQGWIDQLEAVRRNTEALEQRLLQVASTTQANIKALHELGEQVAAEARRGREMCEQVAAGIAQISAQ